MRCDRLRRVLMILVVGLIFPPSTLFAQQTPPPQGAAASAQSAPAPEIATQESQPAFTLKARANEVRVRVVVRDAQGRAVTNLARDDFRLLDNGKPQVIREFSLEFAHPAAVLPVEKRYRPTAEKPPEKVASSPTPPERLVALYFDDTFMSFEDVVRTRQAATHYLETAITPGDRVGLFTSSGQQKGVEFTSDLSAVEQGLAKLRPNPHTGSNGQPSSCGGGDYENYLISELGEMGSGQASSFGAAQRSAKEQLVAAAHRQACARIAWGRYRMTALQSLQRLEALVRQLSVMPGQRSIVWVSPGFLAMDQNDEVTSLIDQALRARVVISALDSRGLWTLEGNAASRSPASSPSSDSTTVAVTQGKHGASLNPQPAPVPVGYAQAEEILKGQLLEAVAFGTGGTFFHDNNDYEAGFRLVGGLPEAAYLLSFSPAALKYDGKFHNLAVQLVNAPGLSVQARKGYFAPSAPPGSERATTEAEEELAQDVFSQSELQTVPISLDTQFFRTATDEAKLTVSVRLDVSHLHLKRQNGRNLDHLAVITALFSYAGEFVTGNRQDVDLRLLDQSLARLKQAGLSLQANFLVKPGQYLVRAVVGEREEGEVSAGNISVEIP